jgi:hypothetical protein
VPAVERKFVFFRRDKTKQTLATKSARFSPLLGFTEREWS